VACAYGVIPRGGAGGILASDAVEGRAPQVRVRGGSSRRTVRRSPADLALLSSRTGGKPAGQARRAAAIARSRRGGGPVPAIVLRAAAAQKRYAASWPISSTHDHEFKTPNSTLLACDALGRSPSGRTRTARRSTRP